jgi:hypothetical protein
VEGEGRTRFLRGQRRRAKFSGATTALLVFGVLVVSGGQSVAGGGAVKPA